VQNDQASRTALLIAASLVLLHRNPKYSGLVSGTAADLCAQILDAHSAQTRLFLKILRQDWFRPIAKSIERITIRGILLHYVLRKKCIAGLVRSALINGATQVVIIGAGFDPLSFELHQEFPSVQFWEIDHPATQRHKVRTLYKIDAERLHFVAMDLSATTFDNEALIKNSFDPTQRTIWIAEGLLMYLTLDVVSALVRTLKSLSAPGNQFVFTFMERQSDGRIRSIHKANWSIGGCADAANHSSGELREANLLTVCVPGAWPDFSTTMTCAHWHLASPPNVSPKER
jgi:methyltransferase (TIGR00027 family)